MMYRKTFPGYTHGDVGQFFTKGHTGKYDVTVVGNGPLHARDRVFINNATNVVRFNDMNNWRPHERVSLRAVHFPSALPPSHECNAPVWAITANPKDLPPDTLLYTWHYDTGLTHASIERWQNIFGSTPQVLEPWQDMVRVFEDCESCGIRCYANQTTSGASVGVAVISELNAMPDVGHIDVFGMNWNGGVEHIDFVYPTMVADCCAKCTIHPTPSQNYGDKALHWTGGLRNAVVTGSAGGISLVAAGLVMVGFLTHHTHKKVRRHLSERKERIRKEEKAQAEEKAEVPLLLPLAGHNT